MQLDAFAVMGETVSFILWLFWSIWHSYFRKSRIMCSSSLMAIRGAWHYGEHLSSEREIHQHLWRGRGKKTPPMEEGKKKKQVVAISSMRKLSSFVRSLRQTWCQAGSTAPVCPASSFSFLCSFRSTEFGPWRLKQGTLLRKTHHHPKKGQFKVMTWLFSFWLVDRCRQGELCHCTVSKRYFTEKLRRWS